MEITNKLRIGTKVKIVETIKKRYLNKIGKIVDKRDNWFGNDFEYLIDIPFIEKQIWQTRSDLEVCNAVQKATRRFLKCQA